jgi:hypothetical protein
MATLVERLSDSVSASGAKVAYGDPITIGGVDTVPVALVWFGFGGGEGPEGEGAGGGGGGASIPIGAYVPGETGPVFQPNVVALMAVAIPLVWVAGGALRKFIRALKK